MATCLKICQALLGQLCASFVPVTVHSAFQSAANLSAPFGLVTLLQPGKSLQPYSLLLEQEMDFRKLENGTLYLSHEGLWRSGVMEVSFSRAQITDLTYRPRGLCAAESTEVIRSFLLEHRDYELVQLLSGPIEGVYAKEIAPRFLRMRQAVRTGRRQEMVSAATALAGCGMGLTPSSDDLLCGYLWALWSREGMEDAIRQMADAAAKRTNDISASLLTRAGNGYFSADVLALAECLTGRPDRRSVIRALRAVAEFGSTSGRDFLTGAYFGLKDICNLRGYPS